MQSTETDRDAAQADQGLQQGSTATGAQTQPDTATTEADAAQAEAAADAAIQLEIEKRKARAAKFGIPQDTATASAAAEKEKEEQAKDSDEVKRKRAERFGLTMPTEAETAEKQQGGGGEGDDARVKKVIAPSRSKEELHPPLTVRSTDPLPRADPRAARLGPRLEPPHLQHQKARPDVQVLRPIERNRRDGPRCGGCGQDCAGSGGSRTRCGCRG